MIYVRKFLGCNMRWQLAIYEVLTNENYVGGIGISCVVTRITVEP